MKALPYNRVVHMIDNCSNDHNSIAQIEAKGDSK